MNKKTVAALIAVPVVAIAGSFYWYGSMVATLERPVFDSYDKKKLQKAYRVMYRKVLTQKYNFDAADMSEEFLDNILLKEYYAL